MNNQHYIYRHRRLDNFSIFYVGKGTIKNYKRAYIKDKRSQFWKNIVSKYGYEVEILIDNLNGDDANELEEFLISIYGRKDLKEGSLVNLTNGGEGVKGIIQTEEVKKWRSDRWKGENNPMYGKFGEENPNYNKCRPEEVKNKILKSNTGKTISDETKQKLREINTGKKHTHETILKMKGRPCSKKTKLKAKERFTGGTNPRALKVEHIETSMVFDTIKEGCDYFKLNYEKERVRVTRGYKTSKFRKL